MTQLALQLDRSGKLNKKELKAKQKLAWQGKADVEDMCKMFATFLTTPTSYTAHDLAHQTS